MFIIPLPLMNILENSHQILSDREIKPHRGVCGVYRGGGGGGGGGGVVVVV